MATIAYTVTVKERGNEGTTAALASYVTAFDYTLLRRGGCGQASITVCLEAEYAAIENLLVTNNIVEITVRLPGAVGYTKVYRGYIERVEPRDNTPPGDKVRVITCNGLWWQLKDPGVKVLALYEDMSIVEVVEDLIPNEIAPYCEVSSATTGVTAADNYGDIARILFEDKTAGDAIKLLADVNQSTVYGVDEDGEVYFADEQPASGTNWDTVQQGVKNDGITLTHREKDISRCVNFYIIEGRTTYGGGNPMVVVAYDSALDGANPPPYRMKKMKAPDLIYGNELVSWGDYLVARDKDEDEAINLTIAGASTVSNAPITVADTNKSVTVNDMGGSLIGKWQIRSVTCALHGGDLDYTFELGTDYAMALMEEMGYRDLLRDIAVLEAKELSNGRELEAAGNDFAETNYIHMAGTNGMRNSCCLKLSNQREIEEALDLDSSTSVLVDEMVGGVSSLSVDGTPGYGQFYTQSIPLGKDYDEYAVYADCGYPTYLANNYDAHRQHFLVQKFIGDRKPDWITYNDPDGESSIVPSYDSTLVSFDLEGAWICQRGIYWYCDILVEFIWGEPWSLGGSGTDLRRWFFFNWLDRRNYTAAVFKQEATHTMKVSCEERVDGAYTGHGSTTLSVLDGERIRLKVDRVSFGNQYKAILTVYNLSRDPVIWAQFATGTDAFCVDAGHNKWGFGYSCDGVLKSNGYVDPWYLKSVTFDDDQTELVATVSRDGGTSYEPGSPGPYFEMLNGTAKDLGAYAGGGSSNGELIVKGQVRWPRVIKNLGLGWK